MQDLTAAVMWMEEEQDLHINMLKIKAVQLALDAFQHRIMGESVVLMSNIAAVVST